MTKKSDDDERRKLRARVTQLTRREPRADASVDYLRNRVAMLERKARAGEDLHAHFDTSEERTRPQSFSLTESQVEALGKFCDKTKKKGSQLVRAALAHYALHLGHVSIARTFDADIANDNKE